MTALLTTLLLSNASPAWACGGGCPPPAAAASAEAETATATCELGVAGMTCASCARSIEKSLGKLDGVREVSLDFESGTATVGYDPAEVRPEDIEARIDGLGGDRSCDTRAVA